MPDQGFTKNRRAMAADRAFTGVSWILGLGGVFLPLAIVAFLAVNGASVITWEFLTERPRGLPLGGAGGIGPAIQGSLALILIGLAVAVPTAVGAAAYMTEFGRSRVVLRSVRFAAECLAGIPSIVYGLFGYAFLVVFLSLKVSLLAGGITLGFVMFPIILIGAQESMEAVEWQYREAALAMGVTRSHMLRRVILPKAWPGILSITVLAAGHAFGTAAPILYTASVIFSHGGLDLSAPVMTLPTHLYYLVGEAVSFDHAFGTALVLVLMLLLFNFLASYVKKITRRQGY